jgi:hypothetical protein
MTNITFVFNHPIQVNFRSTAALVRQALILKARGSCTLLSMGNWVNFSDCRCLTFILFMAEEHKLCAKSPDTSEWEKNCSFLRKSFYVGNKRG